MRLNSHNHIYHLLEVSDSGLGASPGLDLDRDGKRDLAVPAYRAPPSPCCSVTTAARLTCATASTVHKAPHAISFADFDEDGVVDIVTANRDSNTVGLFSGDGSGGFGAPMSLASGPGRRWIAVTNREGGGVNVSTGD